jgi:hypothetical protein
VHQGVFLPGRPATGMLHVAGHRGGDEPAFRLSEPRYDAARKTVSFRAQPLDHKSLPGRGAHATALAGTRTFGAATLSVIPHQTVAPGAGGGNTCEAYMQDDIDELLPGLVPQSYSAWDSDTWGALPSAISHDESENWISEGGLWRGCSNTVVFAWNQNGPIHREGTFTINVTWPWGQLPTTTCTSTNPVYTCRRDDLNGTIQWTLVAAG